MKAELLVVPGCPHEAPARAAFERALASVGVSAPVAIVIVGDDSDARARGFVGSPSFFVDGRDLFPAPFAQRGVACRVYSTADGLRGLPDDGALSAALSGHA